METVTFDASKIHVQFGIIQVYGFARGDMIEIIPMAPEFKSKPGLSGAVFMTQSTDQRAVLRLKLSRKSQSNKHLSTAFNSDRLTKMMVFSTVVKDTSNQIADFYGSLQSRIVKAPDVKIQDQAGIAIWEILLVNLYRFDGG